MRKFLFAALVSTALGVAVPATALARHHHRRHHHSQVRHEEFGSAGGSTTSGGTSSGDEMQGTAGKVDSFMSGVLTIRLNDNSLVSGMVTNETELKCEAPENLENEDNGSEGGSGDRIAMEDGGGQSGDNNSSDDSGGDNQGEDVQMCTTANLTPGTTVQEANLALTGSCAVWDEVDLVTP